MAPMETCEEVFPPTLPQHKSLFIDDLNTCKSLVKFEPSPVTQLLWDLDNSTRKRTFQFVTGIGEERQFPLRLTLTEDRVYDLIQLSLKKRRKSALDIAELPSPESVTSSQPACTPKPLLALEWQAEQPQEWPAGFGALLEDEDEETWFGKPTMSVISDICDLTSKLGNRLPKAAMFLWAQFMQLVSCSKRLLSSEQNENQESNRREVFHERPRGCYLSLCFKYLSEDRSRSVAEKKNKTQETNRSLKRAHGALISKHHDNTNRKRAMASRRFHRGGGRRGC